MKFAATLLAAMLFSLSALAAGPRWRAPAVDDSVAEPLRLAIAEADALYDTREMGNNAQKALDALRALATEHPESWDVQWRLSRAAFWVSGGLDAKKKKERRELSTEGWKAGEKAQTLKPKAPEGGYFMALNIGEYSLSVGVLSALRQGLENKFRTPLDGLTKSAAALDNGGVWNALGRYKYELPWPKKDIPESIAYLRKGIEVNADNLRARAYLADSLAERDDEGDEEEAKKLLGEVARATVGRYDAAEELRAKSIAADIARTRKWTIEGL